MIPAFTETWTALLIAVALAAAWWIVDGPTLFIYPLISRYLDFRFWLTERRMWISETKRWAGTLTAELRVVATIAVLRHHLSTRPRYNSPEWQSFNDHLRQRVDFANNRWRDGKPPIKPDSFLPPWMLSYSGAAFWRENEHPPFAHKPPEPIAFYDDENPETLAQAEGSRE